jgi:adenylyl- and sulfurtransferase ThiI
MNQSTELSLEQEFEIIGFADLVKHMSHEQAQKFLIILHRQMMLRETMYRYFLMHE